jgi:hydroxymethylpyrimidine pyrophosphatase-like HAD family hydrolase
MFPMQENIKQKTFAFDFDGVIADYHGFKGAEHTSLPIPEVVQTIRNLKSLGHTIVIYSTRGTEILKEYCNKHAIPVDYINDNPKVPNENKGKPVANVYIDDRSVCFRRQSSDELTEEIINFKPYWK